MKILVVGGVAGGATAIARLRRLNEEAEIILFERGEYISFANCGLPYFVGGVIPERDALLVSTKESVEAKYGVDIRVKSEVLSIDREKKTVLVHDQVADRQYEESYDKLLLSTGSHPFIPPVEGVDAPNVFSLWTIPDADRILAYAKAHAPQKAVVVGGGFIGLEMAENLVELGIETAVVEMQDQLMPPLDKDMAVLVENHMALKGVKLLLEEGFAGVKDGGKTVMLQSGKALEADLIILSIGVRPNNELAQKAGLELAPRGHIRVNEFMQTSDPAIYAIGDVIAVKEYVTGEETAIPLAGPANKQGREVSANILGQKPSPYTGTMGTSVAKVFDLTVASTGVNEKTLARQGQEYGKDYFVSLVHPMSHAGYYPGAVPLTIKLVFGADRTVLGAQIVGYDGVDKRIDTMATTIHFRGTVDDLANLELAYAPPYSSAKDPVNFAGYVATNILDGLTDVVRYQDYLEAPERYQLLDVRDDDEVIAGMLPGAVHIPLPQLRDRLSELDKKKHYLAYCSVGVRGYIAERILKGHGFMASNLMGACRTVMDLEAGGQQGTASTNQEKYPTAEEKEKSASLETLETLNVCGLSCPGPMVQLGKKMEALQEGDVLEVVATDPGFARDMAAWAKQTGNTLLSQESSKGQFTVRLQKGDSLP